jgi:hypothetical protein
VAAPLALVGTAAVAAGAGLWALKDFVSDVTKYGFGKGSSYGSFSDRVATAGVGVSATLNRWSWGGLGKIGKFLDPAGISVGGNLDAIYQQEQALEKQQKARKELLINQERDEGLGAARGGAMRQRFQDQDTMRSVRMDAAARMFQPDRSREKQLESLQFGMAEIGSRRSSWANTMRTADISRQMRATREGMISQDLQKQDYLSRRELSTSQGELAAAKKRASTLEGTLGGRPSAELDAELDRVAELEQRVAKATESRLEVEKQIATTRQDSAKESIASLQEELAIRREGTRQAEDTYKSGKQRFGEMTEVEQQEVLRIKAKADAASARGMSAEDRDFMQRMGMKESGGGTLSADEEERLQEVRKRQAGAAAAALTKEERKKLGAVDTWYTGQIQEQGALQEANRAGYDRFFAADERRNVELSRRTEKKLEVELRDKRQVQVTSNLDKQMEDVARVVTNAVNAHMAAYSQRLERRVQDELNRQQGQVMAQVNAKQAAAKADE